MTDPGLKTQAQYEHELVECWRRIDADTLYRAALEAERSRLRAELTHEKGSREQAEAICVVLRAHREEYAAQVIEGHAEIANITADNKRLRAELAECKQALRLCVDVIEHISYAWQGQGTHPQTAINAALAAGEAK